MNQRFESKFTGFDVRGSDTIESVGFEFDDGYVLLSRPADEDFPDDPGVYFEFGGQIHSGYNLVSRCTLRDQVVEIRLREALAGIQVFTIELERRSTQLVPALKQIFRGREEVLSVDA